MLILPNWLVDHIDPRGNFGVSYVNEPPIFGHSDVNVFSLTLDFVF